MNDLYNEQMVKRDIPQLAYQAEETILTWLWLFDRPRYQHHDSATQLRNTLSNILVSPNATLPKQDILHSVQKRVTKMSQTCSDPFVVAFGFEVSHAILEACFHQAIRLFEDGKWAPAMSHLKSKEAELDVLVEHEERQNKRHRASNDDDYSSWGIGNLYEVGRAEALRNDFAMQLAMCKGSQLIHLGDIHFKDAMSGDPDDMLARALLAQDDYRYA